MNKTLCNFQMNFSFIKAGFIKSVEMIQVWCLAQTLDIADLFHFFSSLVSFLFFVCYYSCEWLPMAAKEALCYHSITTLW